MSYFFKPLKTFHNLHLKYIKRVHFYCICLKPHYQSVHVKLRQLRKQKGSPSLCGESEAVSVSPLWICKTILESGVCFNGLLRVWIRKSLWCFFFFCLGLLSISQSSIFLWIFLWNSEKNAVNCSFKESLSRWTWQDMTCFVSEIYRN